MLQNQKILLFSYNHMLAGQPRFYSFRALGSPQFSLEHSLASQFTLHYGNNRKDTSHSERLLLPHSIHSISAWDEFEITVNPAGHCNMDLVRFLVDHSLHVYLPACNILYTMQVVIVREDQNSDSKLWLCKNILSGGSVSSW